MAAPTLRFKEFDGDWTLASLNQLSSKIGDGIHATPKYDENGTIPFINGNNLVNGQIIINGNTKRINTEEFQKYNQILSDQTLFLSINGTIGNLAFYKNEQILLGKSVCFINLKNDIDKKFIYLLLQSPQLTKTFNSELTGTTIKNLSLATVRNSEFYYPREKEQTKIATFLSVVDEKIALLSQKLHLLGQYKQGMMHKLFSQQICFKADDGSEFREWKETKLIAISEIIMGSSPKSENYNENSIGLPLLQGNADIKNRLSRPRVYTSEITKTCNKNDILLSVRAPVGFVAISKHNACIGRGLCSIRAKNNHSQDFLYQWLLSYEKSWVSLSQGSTFDSVNSEQIKNLCLVVPCLEEQTKIANFLSAIDQKVKVVSEQLEQAKLWKKGLLQQMFV